MATHKSEVILTMNGKAVINVLEAIKNKAKEVEKSFGGLKGKELQDAKDLFNALNSAEESIIKNTERLDHAVENLSKTSLQNLKKALGDGRRELQSLSEEELDKADEIRKKMKLIGDEVRLLEGQYVNIAKGIRNVNTQSDQWLSKAISQQKELVGSINRGTVEYVNELQVLKQLEAEEDRRRGKMSINQAMTVSNLPGVSASDLRRAKAAITEARDNTSTSDKGGIKRYNDALANIDKRLDAVTGKEKAVEISWRKMRQVMKEPFKSSAEDIRKTMDGLQQRIEKLPAGSDLVKRLRREYEQLEKTLKGTRMSQQQLNDILTRAKNGKASIDELKRAYKQLDDELQHIKTSDAGFKQKQKEALQLKKQIDEVTGAAKNQSSAFKTTLKNMTAYFGVFQMFSKAQQLITGVIKKNFDYSASLTDIRKVSGFALEEVNELSRQLAKIDTRTSVEGLAQLAYQGAKLGMSKYGIGGMAAFVRAADQINVAIGEEMGEEALPALSKMVETMGLIPKMGIEKAMLATGSAMFKLSTTSTATSGNIVEFSKRLTGVSRTAGITTDQLLALASASDSLFLMPEVSATAMSKFIVALQKNHNLIEKDLGIQEGTIKNLYAAGRAMDAIVLVLEKMRDKGNMNALGGIFKDLGSDGQRLVTAMVTMSKNVDVLKDHLYESQQAFEDASAVTAEYTMQQTSAAGILERAQNLWSKAFVNPEGVENVRSMAQAWYDMSNMMLNSPIYKGTLNTALQAVILSTKMLILLLPVLMNYFVSLGIVKGIAALWEMGKAIRAAYLAQQALNTAVKVNPYAALASVIMTVVGVMWSYANAAKEAAKAEEEAERKANAWKGRMKEAEVETDNLTRKLHSYKTALDAANLSEEERNKQIARFNKDFRSYISKLGIEIKNVDDLRKHYQALSDEIQRATYYRLREEAKADAMPKLQRDRLAAENRVKTHLGKFQNLYGGFTSKSIMDMFARGSNALGIYQAMIRGSLKNVDRNSISFDNRTGAYTYTLNNGVSGKSTGDQELLSALRHYQNATARERDKEKEINDYFGDFVPEGYTPWIDEEPGTLENNAPDKDAAKERREQERAWREELRQKQDEANAIMDNVRNFYERQINVKLSEAISLGMDKTEQDLFVEPVKQRMNMALEQVRLAIAGQANTWEEFKQTMQDDLYEQADATGVNLSAGLLDGITSNNIDALRAQLQQLGNSLSKPLNSILAEVFAKATKNAQENLKLTLQQQEARRKEIMEHDYTGIVQQSAYDQFNLLGFGNPTSSEIADQVAFDKRKQAIRDMFESARSSMSSILGLDMAAVADRGVLLTMLFGEDADGMGERIAAVLGDSEEQWRLFYQKLIQYSDEYTQAQKKQADERKKLNDFAFSLTGASKFGNAAIDMSSEQSKESKRQYAFGKRADIIAPWGQTEATDPEIALLQLKMQLAREYYDYIRAHGATEEQLIEAGKNVKEAYSSIMDAVVAKAKATADAQMKWYKPIEKYGSALGEAVFDESKTVKDATKDMINSFIDLTGEYVQQKMTQWIMTKLYNTFIAESENELAAQKQANAVKNATTAVTEAGVEVPAGIASASAKTLGTLGWWGIPLLAVISGVLGGLLSMAKGALSKAFGSKTPDAGKTNTKLVSGMLTYDSGNVQDLHPFVGNDGEVYWATQDSGQHRGVSLLTQPTATTINGAPALVAERGPELVIGRETTAAMMQNDPALLRTIYQYDRFHSGRTAYDAGNIGSTLGGRASESSSDPDTRAMIAGIAQMLPVLLARLNEPLNAKIDMYGRGNLYDSLNQANSFMRGK